MTTLQERLAAKAVARGARLLDKIMPGWDKKIDLHDLDLSDGSTCVLGQLFDEPQTRPAYAAYGYSSARAMRASYKGTGITCDPDREVCISNYALGTLVLKEAYPYSKRNQEELAIAHGFQASDEADYPDLDKVWTEVIKERQKVA